MELKSTIQTEAVKVCPYPPVFLQVVTFTIEYWNLKVMKYVKIFCIINILSCFPTTHSSISYPGYIHSSTKI
jgi:hypothetical protein